MKKDIFAIYFPSWHPDRHYAQWYGDGFCEWELMKTTNPLFEGHPQPKKPLWGYFDESDPIMMEKQIDLAADNGITGFLFDWYWYQGERFLEKPLDEAFLNAPNKNRLKFALMWANHNWGIWPAMDDSEIQPMCGCVNQAWKLFLKTKFTREDLADLVDYCCEKYFCHENYWKINGKPVFSLFKTNTLFASIPAAEVKAIMDTQAKKNGFAGIYYLINVGSVGNNAYMCAWDQIPSLKAAGFDAVFAYNIVPPFPNMKLPREYPVFDYSDMANSHKYCWEKLDKGELIHFPSVTLGLDVSPRWSHKVSLPMDYENLNYYPICIGNTPEKVRNVLVEGLKKDAPAVIINAWNEWSEGMALLPDEQYGTGFLDMIREANK